MYVEVSERFFDSLMGVYYLQFESENIVFRQIYFPFDYEMDFQSSHCCDAFSRL